MSSAYHPGMTPAARVLTLLLLALVLTPAAALACLKGDECDSGCCRGTQCQPAEVCEGGSEASPLLARQSGGKRVVAPAWVWAGLAAFAAAGGAAAVRGRRKRRGTVSGELPPSGPSAKSL